MSRGPRSRPRAAIELITWMTVWLTVADEFKSHCLLFDVVEELDEAAKAIGAINNIYKRDNRLFGANTDWIGISSKCMIMNDITHQQSRLTILFPPCRIPTTSLA